MSPPAEETKSAEKKEEEDVIFAFSFLTFVAVSKTLLTKFVFTHVDTPVAFSVLSCIATMIVIAPIFLFKPSLFGWIRRDMFMGFLACSAAIAIDLGCTNVAISELSVAMQQTIKATSPAATVLLEVAFNKKCHHPLIFFLIGLLCAGSVLVKWGSSDYDATPYGLVMMIVAVVSGAFKYVMAHAMIRSFRDDLGVLAFTFWVEAIVSVMLTPWAGVERRGREAHLRRRGEHRDRLGAPLVHRRLRRRAHLLAVRAAQAHVGDDLSPLKRHDTGVDDDLGHLPLPHARHQLSRRRHLGHPPRDGGLHVRQDDESPREGGPAEGKGDPLTVGPPLVAKALPVVVAAAAVA